MSDSTPRLGIGLIPQAAWGRNLRAVVSGQEWARLRWEFGAALERPSGTGGYDCGRSCRGHDFLVCEICEGKFGGLHLHELWDFNHNTRVQKLIGLKAICEDCHNVVHFGRAEIVGLADRSVEHLKGINGWTDSQVSAHVNEAKALWLKQSWVRYELDFDWLFEKNLVSRKKVHLSWLDRPRRVHDRLDALSWSRSILELPDVVILDTETTGLIEGRETNPDAEVIELAIISVKGDVLYNKRFKPLHRIPDHVVAIHGITNQAVSRAPSFAKEYRAISKALDGRVVVAYNSRFDQKLIDNTCRLHDLNLLDGVVWECAMWAYKGYQESPQFLRLPNGKHSALGDCVATLELINRMAKGETIQ